MPHYIHQLVVNCICLLFVAEQVVYSGFLQFFHCKQLPAVAENKRYESGKSEPKQKIYRPDSSAMSLNSL